MEKDKIFFGKDGLTSTSANHVANLAKEYYKSQEVFLDSLKFYSASVNLIGGLEQTIQMGTSDISKIPTILKNMAKAKSLIAWLREAIKARENLINEVYNMDITEYCKKFNIKQPERPVLQNCVTENDCIANLSVNERNRYYYLETLASTLGIYIHPGGAYAEARTKLNEILQNPYKVSENGRDTIIYHYTPSISQEEIDKQFFELQKEHREAQASLNSIKFDFKNAIDESLIATSSAYQKELEDYDNKIRMIYNDLNLYKNQETQKISKLKIIIPDSLKDIFETIKSLGK